MNPELVSLILKDDVKGLSEHADNESICSSSYAIDVGHFCIIPMNSLSLMHVAAYANATECLTYLHKTHKLSVNTVSSEGLTPFHYACFGGAAKCARLILSILKENSDENNDLIQTLFNADYSNARLNLPLLTTNNSSTEIMNLLFENGYSFEKYQPDQKIFIERLLNHAIYLKNTGCLEILLKHIKQTKNSSGYTLLMLAVIARRNQTIPIILKTECDPEAMTNDHRTALEYACFQGNYEAARMISDVIVNIDIPRNIDAPSAVHWICQSQDIRIAEIFLPRGINVNRLDNEGRAGPFFMLDTGDEDENIKILDLLYKYGFNVNLHANGKNSLLGEYVSSMKLSYKIIEWLLSKGADTSYPLYRGFRRKEKAETIGEFMRRSSKYNKKMKELVDKYL